MVHVQKSLCFSTACAKLCFHLFLAPSWLDGSDTLEMLCDANKKCKQFIVVFFLRNLCCLVAIYALCRKTCFAVIFTPLCGEKLSLKVYIEKSYKYEVCQQLLSSVSIQTFQVGEMTFTGTITLLCFN